MKQSSYSPVKTVQKAVRLLEVLAEVQPVKPSELAKKLNVSRSNLYRLLTTLEGMGFVEKTLDAKYTLGFKVFILGSTALEINNLPTIARPFMAHLAEISQENVNLAIIYENNKVLYIDKIESKNYLRLDQPIGKTDPLYCTALGKALLSGLTDPELEIFLKSTNLIPYTNNTITASDVLAGVIKNVRKQGYAIDFEELAIGIHCIGAPIYSHLNKVIAAVSISGPSIRLTKQKMEDLKIPLVRAAMEISKKLGFANFPSSNLL